MFGWGEKKEPTPCTHPKWEVIKEIDMPSMVEQMKLETLTAEAKEKVLSGLSPSDFNKTVKMILNCPFCGTIKDFVVEADYTKDRQCKHDWDVLNIIHPSSFQQTVGNVDITHEQRLKISSRMQPRDFVITYITRCFCKKCGKTEEYKRSIGSEQRDDTCRCPHDWKIVAGEIITKPEEVWFKAQSAKKYSIKQDVLMTCNICGAVRTEELESTIEPLKD